MAVNKVPETINDMRAYIDGGKNEDMIGVKEVELPEFSSMTTEVTGIGLAGKVDAPVHGHFEGMETKLTWQLPTKTAATLVGGKPISLELYADKQYFDSGSDAYVHEQYRVAVRGRIKSHKPGSIKAGEPTDSETVIETHYIKIDIGGSTVCEVDKYGYKCVVNGTDYLEAVRRNIGM
ncbi:phage major tail tube protein [Selenomonas ruminantium]|jgi:P2 family phage contractile tail tube protein|uniref:Phage major tail tube protein n=1 Tax=Selenomonas ruminantium TaxID=971 RepID=A0A1H0P6N4_SELRU|nr:phage major tail tube protein [Selenomonas ruminantium]SDP00747.1 hypothetical protein SAMN05216366_104138 [Selenomonas ruminantium]